MELALQPGTYAICRLDPGSSVPGWAAADLLSTLRNEEELSLVCGDAGVPEGVTADRGWRLLRLVGSQDLALTGVLVQLLEPLGAASVPIFAISSYDTDHVLVPGARLEDAVAALEGAGHEVSGR